MIDDLIQAAFNGDLSRVERLLHAGVDVNAAGAHSTPLHAAIEGEQLECIKVLIRHGADIEKVAGGLTPLAHAVDIAIDGTIQTGGSQGDEPTCVVEFLLSHGANPQSALQVAESYGSRKLTQLLTAAGAARWLQQNRPN